MTCPRQNVRGWAGTSNAGLFPPTPCTTEKRSQEQILKKLGYQVRNNLTLGQLASSEHKRFLGVFSDCSDLTQWLVIVCWR